MKMLKTTLLTLSVIILAFPFSALGAVTYNPYSLTVVENNDGLQVQGMGLTDDTLQAAYEAGGGQVSIPHERWANAPDTGAVLTVYGDNDDYIFTGAYSSDRALGEIRMYTEKQTNWKRFYDFDLYFSTSDAPTTFIKFLTITRQSDVIRGVEIIISDFNGQIDNVSTVRMYTRGGINPDPGNGMPDQTYWSEIDIILVESGTDCSLLYSGDLNGDLTVNVGDFGMFSTVWLETDPTIFGCADFSENGQIDIADLQLIAADWLTDYSSLVTVIPSTLSLGKYESLTMDITTSSAFTDPYNPVDIRVDAVITAPDLSEIILPCFYVSGSSGNSQWQGRFTPRQEGEYSYNVKVYVSDILEGLSDTLNLTVVSSTKDGFVTLNTPGNYYSFIHDSGKRFRGIGENVGWEGESGYSFDTIFSLLGAQNANFVRTWLISPKTPESGLEWNSLGDYNQTAANRIDELMVLCETNGVYLMLSIDHHNLFMTSTHLQQWLDSPYNSTNGGPCATPGDFFTNATAKDYYKRKLRYMVARWGYHPYLCVWEFFNEVDYVNQDEGVPVADIANWHDEMSTYLKSIDPFDHIVTTSLSHNDYSQLWNLSNMDFTQRHLYGSTDSLYSTITTYESSYSKPFVAGEFSKYWQGPWALGTPDEYERELHMGLWRGMFSPTPILPLTWWWDWHAKASPWDDYFHFGTASNFITNMMADDSVTISQMSVSTSPNVEEMGLAAGDDKFVWIRNNSGSSTTVTMTVVGLSNGTYELNYYDPWTGTYSSPVYETVTTGTLQSTTSSLADDEDIACWFYEL